MAEEGSPEVVLPFAEYVNYYDLEHYLFEQVEPRFQSEHCIGAFDFFSIVIWKANRAKSRIAERLRRKALPGEDLDTIARRLTASLDRARDACERFRLLVDQREWGVLPAHGVCRSHGPLARRIYRLRRPRLRATGEGSWQRLHNVQANGPLGPFRSRVADVSRLRSRRKGRRARRPVAPGAGIATCGLARLLNN